ncbi:MAG: BlaI/MecI/CopY family transcriptional regulator [Bacteroidales bacterium]|nr:BlaI/MecI/CopY family transcriptional regulator [Bacteroidales bacterium]
MTSKGILSRETKGKMHLYSPVIKEDEAQKAMLDKLLDNAFRGSAQKLIMKALGSYKASKEEIDEIRAILDKIEKENQ